MKLALGGAQFGLAYGVANTSGQVALPEASRILQMAYKQGVRVIDTAIAYGESEKALGQVGVAGWECNQQAARNACRPFGCRSNR